MSRFYETEPKADDTEYVLGFYLSAVQVGTRRVSEPLSLHVYILHSLGTVCTDI